MMSKLTKPNPLDVAGLIYASNKATRNKLMRDWIESRFNDDGFGLSQEALDKMYGVLDKYKGTEDYTNLENDLDSAFENNFDGYGYDYTEDEDEDDDYGPTGIADPADYIGKVTIEKDTDNDGDLDTKVTEYK